MPDICSSRAHANIAAVASVARHGQTTPVETLQYTVCTVCFSVNETKFLEIALEMAQIFLE